MRFLILFSLFASLVPAQNIPENQLPTGVRPLGYQLVLNIQPVKDSFSGTARIKIRFDKKTREFWMHGENLTVSKSELKTATQTINAHYKQVSPEDVVLITLDQEIEPGEAELEIDYKAAFPKDLAGLYKVVHNKTAYVYSQFEPIAARSCFPSFDEPRFKTPFEISLTIPQLDAGISNGALLKETKNKNKTKTLLFEKTPPLPTYLIAFAVGPFDIIKNKTDSRIPLRGIAPKGQGARIQYALEETPKIVQILEDYFGIPYPYSKLDIIAVPDFAAGAMENAGAITFRDSLLLMDPKTAPVMQLRHFAEVMAHELAHQWFGDLVTMNWWNDIWLNEAFATWMAAKTVMRYNPSYHADWAELVGTQYAMNEDSLKASRKIQEPILTQHDIYSAFDAITYTKGAAVIGMFENYIGASVFQAGVRNYLKKYSHRNADTEDFIAELSGAANQNLKSAFGSFLTQPGVPLIDFQYDRYRQYRYLPLGSELSSEKSWEIPFCPSDSKCQLLERPRGTLSDFGFPLKNGKGYYRFSGLKQLDKNQLNDSEQIVLIANLEASFHAGKFKPSQLLPQLAEFTNSPNRLVAIAPISTLYWLKDKIDPPGLAEYAKALYSKNPPIAEPEEQKLFEVTYLNFQAEIVNDPTVRQELVQKALAYLKNPSKLDSNQVRTALTILMQEQPARFNSLRNLLFKSQDAIQRSAIINALGESDQALSLILSPKLRKNEILSLFSAYMENPKYHETGLDWLQQHAEALIKQLPKKSSGHLPATLSGLCSDAHAVRAQTLLEPIVKDLPGGPRALSGALEEIRLCIALKKAQEADALKFFKPSI